MTLASEKTATASDAYENSGPAYGKEAGTFSLFKSRVIREENPLFSPAAICVSSENVFVADEVGNALYRFSFDLGEVKRVGKKGCEPGNFWYPTALSWDEAGGLYVADRWNHRIQIFDEDLKFKGAWGSYGSNPGQFQEPMGIVCRQGRVFVAERTGGRIQAFDRSGKLLALFENSGAGRHFYESALFKKNVHYMRWLRQVSRYHSVESAFREDGFVSGILEYPEALTLTPGAEVICLDRINQQAARFSQDLSFLGYQTLPQKELTAYHPVALANPADGTLWTVMERPGLRGEARLVQTGNQGSHIFSFPKNPLCRRAMRIQAICFHNRHAYVADFWNGAICILEMPASLCKRY